MSQNLISAELPAPLAAEIVKSLTDIKAKMPFLSTLQSTDVKYLFKTGNAYLPFLDLIHQVVISHPEILPAVFDKEEFLRDYELVAAMRPIFNAVNELSEAVEKTFFAASSDSMVAAFEVYSSVKQNKDKVAGMSVISDELAVFFKKTKSKTEAAAQPAV
jgi:hypothetical protein